MDIDNVIAISACALILCPLLLDPASTPISTTVSTRLFTLSLQEYTVIAQRPCRLKIIEYELAYNRKEQLAPNSPSFPPVSLTSSEKAYRCWGDALNLLFSTDGTTYALSIWHVKCSLLHRGMLVLIYINLKQTLGIGNFYWPISVSGYKDNY